MADMGAEKQASRGSGAVNLDHARTLATGPVDDSADIDALRLVVLELCDEVERLRAL